MRFLLLLLLLSSLTTSFDTLSSLKQAHIDKKTMTPFEQTEHLLKRHYTNPELRHTHRMPTSRECNAAILHFFSNDDERNNLRRGMSMFKMMKKFAL